MSGSAEDHSARRNVSGASHSRAGIVATAGLCDGRPGNHGLFILPAESEEPGSGEAVTAALNARCPACNTPLQVSEYRMPLFAGFGERRLRAVRRCEVCAAAEQAQAEARALQVLRQRLLNSSGIPVEAQPLSLNQALWTGLKEDPLNDAALEKLRAWVDGDHSLYLSGPPGSGKTVLALAAAMDCLRAARPVPVAFVRDQDFFQLARARWRGDEPELALERLGRVPILVYDDLGRHHLTDYVREAMYDLLNERCPAIGGRRKTLITGNMPSRELSRWLDGDAHALDVGALSSRFYGLVDDRCIALLGGDRRRGRPPVGR